MTELLPCPFCGEEPLQRGDFIECSNCCAQGPTDREPKTGWNTRFKAAKCESLLRRVAVLEMVIKEELHGWDCHDDLNKMIVDEIQDRSLSAVGGSREP